MGAIIFTVVYAGYVGYMSWVIRVARRGGPDWKSGRPGDLLRMSQRVVIVGSIVGMVVLGLLTLLAWFVVLTH